MKKIFLIVLVLIFVCGCEGNYQIDVFDDHIKETIDIDKITFSNEETVDSYFSYPISAFQTEMHANFVDLAEISNVAYYKKSIDKTGTTIALNYNYNFPIDNYANAYGPTYCYQFFNVFKDGDELEISTSVRNTCFDFWKTLDKLTVTINTNYLVEGNNADEEKITDNQASYIWVINKDNFEDKSISIQLNKSKTINGEDIKEEVKETNNPVVKVINSFEGSRLMIIYAVIVIAIVIVLVYVISKMGSKNNKL